MHTIILSNLLALPIDFGFLVREKLLLGQTVVFSVSRMYMIYIKVIVQTNLPN
ncbi:hypothetical protein EMIT0180MI3_340109 [Priestia megaterium]